MFAGVRHDFIKEDIDLSYPRDDQVQLHHIFPKALCEDNLHDPSAAKLKAAISETDIVNSIANLMPMDRTTNNQWKTQNPATFIERHGLKFGPLELRLRPVFIDKVGFALLKQGLQALPEFWHRRAALIATDLHERMHIKLA